MVFYAEYYKCALQVNPFSYAKYRGEAVQNEDVYNDKIVEKCKQCDIRVVGLADHGSVDTTETLRKKLQESGIVVFPGFEISSAEKIHMVCLFPPEKTLSELNQILGSLGFPATMEVETDPSTKSCIEIAKTIKDAGGFWYAAHITGDNGILKLGQMQQVWKDKLLVAAQIPASKEEIDPKYVNIIRNNDPQYKRARKVALINAKDIEKPEDLEAASASTLIKMTAPSFDNFVMAFNDPESRIRLNSEVENTYQSCIRKIEVFGGYLDGLVIEFSDNLTTLIGGRGTGKSTIINLIRYAMNIKIEGKEEKKEFDNMITANLGSQGRIEIEVVSNSYYGKKFKIIRRYNQKPVIEDEKNNVVDLEVKELLPLVEIYGQNEIIGTVNNQERIEKIVKRLFPENQQIKEKIEEAYDKLKDNGNKLGKVEEEIESSDETVSDLPAVKERLKYFETAGIDKKLSLITKLSTEEAQFESYENRIPSEAFSITTLGKIETDNTELLNYEKAIDEYNETVERIKAIYQLAVDKLKKEYDKEKTIWENKRNECENEVKESLKGIEGIQDKSASEIVAEYTELVKKAKLAEPIQSKKDSLEKQKQQLLQERKNIIEECRKCWDESDAELQKQIKKLNKKKLNGKVRLSIKFHQQKQELVSVLSKIDRVTEKGLKGILDYQDFEIFTFVDNIRQGGDVLSGEYSLTASVADKIVMSLSEKQLRELEELQLKNIYVIELEVGGNFKTIDRLSKGQQCTAILNILLLDNKDPLVVDQPEDNLDNSFIAENLIELIRENKIKRQYIFATHNANIPVFGDAELIVAMEEKEGQGQITENGIGSIDAKDVKEKVVQILEGGRDAFQMRKRKYNID